MRSAFGVAALSAVAILCACVPPPPADPHAAMQAVAFTAIPGWSEDRLGEALPALQASCRRLLTLPASTELGGQSAETPNGGSAGQWLDACRALSHATADDVSLRRMLEAWFQPYRVTAPALFTGYYEPEVAGSLTRDDTYQTPVLARPSDLLRGPPSPADPNAQPTIGRLAAGLILPYWTRREIEAGAAGGTARTLFWLRSPIDLFFMQVQGAGRVRLPDGAVTRLAFDGKNGRPYTPIGRLLVERRALAPSQVSMQTIRSWLEAHPAEARGVMDANEDYVFFRVVTPQDDRAGEGPPGAMGVHLTAGRSAAVDRHFVPLGAPLFVDTTDPLTRMPFRRLVVAQDIGSDIKGAGRTDIFLGAGDIAATQAGAMRQTGTEYILLPRPPR